jgi:phosphoribosylglycinamide formyltransferase
MNSVTNSPHNARSALPCQPCLHRHDITKTMTSQFIPPSSSSKLLVLISGNGSNLQALIDACNTPALATTSIIRVISNRKDAFGLQRAQKASIPTTYHNLVKYKKAHPDTDAGVQAAREEYDRDLAKIIIDEGPDLVVCAGFMHVLSSTFCAMLSDAKIDIINLHPALPGKYNGAKAIDRAHADYQKGEISGTGVMIHYVIAEVDMGDPIVVKEVDMKVEESLGELEARIHEVEHGLIVEGTRVALESVNERKKRASADGTN